MAKPRIRRAEVEMIDDPFWPEDDALLEAELRARLANLEWIVDIKSALWRDPGEYGDDFAALSRRRILEGHTPPPGLAAKNYPPDYPIPPRVDYIAQMSPACRAAITPPFDRTYDGVRVRPRRDTAKDRPGGTETA